MNIYGKVALGLLTMLLMTFSTVVTANSMPITSWYPVWERTSKPSLETASWLGLGTDARQSAEAAELDPWL